MEKNLVLKLISDVICAVNDLDQLEVNENDSVDTILEWDSLTTVNLAAAISSEFNVKISSEQLEEITSVKGIMSLLEID